VIGVDQQFLIQRVEDGGIDRSERARQREVIAVEAGLELRQHALRECAGCGRGRWARAVAARLAERAENRRGHERRVDGKEHTDLVLRRAQAGDDAGQRRAERDTVVDHFERQLELPALTDREPLVAGFPEHAPTALGERLAAEARVRLRRPEPPALAADEQHAGQLLQRHRRGSS